MAIVRLRGQLEKLAGSSELTIEGGHRDRAAAGARERALRPRGLDPRRARRAAPAHQRLRQRRARRAGHARSRRRTRSRSFPRSPADDPIVLTDDRTARRDPQGPLRARGRAGRGSLRSRRARSSASPSTTRCATRAPGACSRRSRRRSGDRGSGSPTASRATATGSRRAASRCPRAATEALKRIWVIVPGEADGLVYAGGDPGVLFESRDDGETWELNQALWEHPTRPRWRRDSGGLSVHSIVPWPGEPRAPRARDLRRRRLADRGRRRDVGARQRGDRRRLPARGGARDARSTSACTISSARRCGPSGCSCSFTAASTAPTTPAARGRTSPPGCRTTSASPSCSIRPIPTARS